MTRRVTVRCEGVEATRALATTLALRAVPGGVVVLTGGLGAGKTTFVKAYAAALGVRAPVTSPTYTLVHHYRCGAGAPVSELLHADCWRLDGVAELDDLALDEPLDEGAHAVVEWGERYDVGLGRDRVVVRFELVDDTTRAVHVDATASLLADDVLDSLAAA